MPTNIFESDFCFSFSDQWQVIKFDHHPVIEEVGKVIEKLKRVDFMGVHQATLYVIEVKNFSGHLPENENKIKGSKHKIFAIDLAQKCLDSLVWALYLGKHSHRPEFEQFGNLIENGRNHVKYVVWIELDYPVQDPVTAKVLKANFSFLLNVLKTKIQLVDQINSIDVLIVDSESFSRFVPELRLSAAPCP